MEYVPSAIVGKVQLVTVEEATKVQVTDWPDAGLAVNVIVAPEVNPPMLMVGVLSFVILSEFEVPVSEAESSVGVPVETNAPIAIVRVKTPNNTVSDFPPNS
jgi:hypothetical protein